MPAGRQIDENSFDLLLTQQQVDSVEFLFKIQFGADGVR